MEGFVKPIGGEFWFDSDIFNMQNDNFSGLKATYLSGGQSALKYILEDIHFKEDEYILIPSFLCPSILFPIKALGINYEFYSVKRDLSIDIYDISNKCVKYKTRAVFFIDYFGFYHNRSTLEYLSGLKEKGIVLIEDAVQMLWFEGKSFIGDYTFNSYRKFLPADGSIVLGNNVNSFEFKKENYYERIYRARMNKTMYIKLGIGNEKDFLDMFSSAEDEYYRISDISGMDDTSRRILSKVDVEFITTKRLGNFIYITESIADLPGISGMFNKDDITDNVPIGVPVIINNNRNVLRSALMKSYIFCPIHWDITGVGQIMQDYKDSVFLSNHILTIPIDHRYDYSDLDRLIVNLKKLLTEVC